MKHFFHVAVVVIWFMTLFCNSAGAEERRFSFSIAGGLTSALSGDAGEGPGAPGYSDAFGRGYLVSAEIAYRLNPTVSILGGVGYESFSGDTYEGISFSNLDIVPIYTGMKYYFTNRWPGWNPYLRADIGLARFKSVSISYMDSGILYWNSSFELMMDAGTGIEYRMNSMTWFAEIRARYMDNPSSALAGYSGAGGSWSMPVMVGIRIDF